MSDRYSRQERFAPIGREGQDQLSQKHVFIVGAGALGSANAEMLARAGAGKITIIDRDYIEWSNLGRQQLYTEEDAASLRTKASAAEQHLRAINSEIEIHGIAQEFEAETAETLVEGADFLIDGTDNFQTRFVINDVAAKLKVPWVYGGCLKSYGIVLPIVPGKTPCLHCLIDHLPQEGGTCDTVGIIGPAVQMTAAYQTAECLKFLTGHAMSEEMIYVDVWGREYSSINVSKLLDAECSSCSSDAIYPYLKKEKGLRTAMLCGRNTVQVRPDQLSRLSLSELRSHLKPLTERIKENGELLMFHVEDVRFVVFKDGRTLIHGTEDVQEAKKLYQRYIGA
ncbi:thiazole biosynthesis adenylyltransferase ThiF [Halobacillus andaensis]|uniref:Thiazole biosynthesis adenylyltransferase ThiF n=1 Tax=Halobacillus andaensis TaxID=1176239 RepID=A0A917B6F9_HALAA|nr:ThiF family adenylyltransferase [Halobacillus andaensis]MBP2006430.1 adenylyltransferase/sulfurtransferase [Halobacillus andaensis]GGF27344.1 thiazole biosynthesis adenylyltransferase ThiF [Halobacillus andaensis]